MLRASRRWFGDPGSVAGNSPGSFEELFRSLVGPGGVSRSGPGLRRPLWAVAAIQQASGSCGFEGRASSCQTNNDYAKQPRCALYTCFLYLSSYTSSVSSPVPLQVRQVPLRYGCNPVPPHSGQMIGSRSSMALLVFVSFFVLFGFEGEAHRRADSECQKVVGRSC